MGVSRRSARSGHLVVVQSVKITIEFLLGLFVAVSAKSCY